MLDIDPNKRYSAYQTCICSHILGEGGGATISRSFRVLAGLGRGGGCKIFCGLTVLPPLYVPVSSFVLDKLYFCGRQKSRLRYYTIKYNHWITNKRRVRLLSNIEQVIYCNHETFPRPPFIFIFTSLTYHSFSKNKNYFPPSYPNNYYRNRKNIRP